MKHYELEKIIDKAKTKKDGLYSHNGIAYAVIDGYPKYLIDGNDIFQFSGFLVCIGKLPFHGDKKKALKEVMVY